MKKIYTSPTAEVIEFDVKDVITTSTAEISNDDDGYVWTGFFPVNATGK